MRYLPLLVIGTIALVGCAARPDESAWPEPQAMPVVTQAYERGYIDGRFRTGGVRAGTAGGDIGGLEGDAWRLGWDDATTSRPYRTDDELRTWWEQWRAR